MLYSIQSAHIALPCFLSPASDASPTHMSITEQAFFNFNNSWMVLFTEAETLRLLELDAALRDNPNNVSKNGVLLKQRAREILTASLNQSFPRQQPWTVSQVAVKFKNLRGEYAEFKWLSAQPGFHSDGTGMSEDWWQNAKRLRPKCHAFKGKLPWVFEARMKQVVGDGGPDYSQEHPVERRQLKEEELSEEEELQQLYKQQHQVEVEAAETVATNTATTVGTSEEMAVAPPPRHKRKRSIDGSEGDVRSRSSREQEREQGSSATTASDDTAGDYSRSLARSVEQSSVAAAGMTRGFQDLISIFQQQTAKCRELEQLLTQRNTETPSLVLAEQRSVLLSIARSLEQSTRATADMAQGYRELVKAFVRGSDSTRQQREC
ncbi:hypothetical protein PC129_g12973 [Phytophthora cactorum]|uniref:Myb/SANT-like domain-containing protein n=3 Tax=Phytophthora cactorum TaxID=29920 RepID=A0A8T1CJB2_9STRA|nr:hypothetical protein PC111_g13668 [Phytophthora cactorum]KAG2822962.1 hypothetical protein PC112_g10707 [Phytophthora cactorum]KAG2893684.1 hypothetical protein PC114_g16163 [Phytophthora cactorum]KAG2906954.1 hypothetical protein PC115_g14099 [Phytophthora cactorum]KAG2924065.1 hypothetical protein PC117_g15511 [Phytophthora cactorum]